MAFLDWIEANVDALVRASPASLAYAVKRSCEIKALVVGQDERETGLRAISISATPSATRSSRARLRRMAARRGVGCGMVMAAHLSQRLGGVDAAFVERLTRLIQRAGLPTVGPALGADRYLELMRVDKKAEAGDIRFVVIDKPGRPWCAARPKRWCAKCSRSAARDEPRGLCLPARAVAVRLPTASREPPSPRPRAMTSSAIATASCIPPRSAGWSTRPRCS
jgi:3-dehydroquinate synthetase